MTETLTSRFEARPASPLIGAEIEGVDLTRPVDQVTAEALREAFWTYKVLVFRGQHLSPLQHVAAVRIFDSPLPLVAAVQGAAIGAGFGLALACDICVVGELGWFQANFVRLGIHPGFALSTTLPRVVGPGRAAELLLTGRRVDAVEAERIGIAQRVVPAGGELDAALEVATHVAAGAPLAVSSTRATLRHGLADRVSRSGLRYSGIREPPPLFSRVVARVIVVVSMA